MDKKEAKEDDRELLKGDVVFETNDGLTSIKLIEKVDGLVKQSIMRTMAIKLLGRVIGFNTPLKKKYAVWVQA
ncbi:hypothetical protein J1N35_041166 [Gossypium stocksii]|uniref:Uncharacterized protein n=1 Tax=Gossypium stocksii TaxID=47602 RepID=A0A9D3UFH2_9ROSI|nr:hypothetical protein J1N35_041166 [Gossypium stocksii]